MNAGILSEYALLLKLVTFCLISLISVASCSTPSTASISQFYLVRESEFRYLDSKHNVDKLRQFKKILKTAEFFLNYEKYCPSVVIYVNPLPVKLHVSSGLFIIMKENVDFHFLLTYHAPNLIASDFITQKYNIFKIPDCFNWLWGPVKLIFKEYWWFLLRG